MHESTKTTNDLLISADLRQRSALDKTLLYSKSNDVSDNGKSNGSLIEDKDDSLTPSDVSANNHERDDENIKYIEQSKTCIITLCKIIDNILNESKYNPKTRVIKLSNRLFRERIEHIPGGACNFIRSSHTTKKDASIKLLKENEEKNVLFLGRSILQSFGQNHLNLSIGKKRNELPPFRFEKEMKELNSNSKCGYINKNDSMPYDDRLLLNKETSMKNSNPGENQQLCNRSYEASKEHISSEKLDVNVESVSRLDSIKEVKVKLNVFPVDSFASFESSTHGYEVQSNQESAKGVFYSGRKECSSESKPMGQVDESDTKDISVHLSASNEIELMKFSTQADGILLNDSLQDGALIVSTDISLLPISETVSNDTEEKREQDNKGKSIFECGKETVVLHVVNASIREEMIGQESNSDEEDDMVLSVISETQNQSSGSSSRRTNTIDTILTTFLGSTSSRDNCSDMKKSATITSHISCSLIHILSKEDRMRKTKSILDSSIVEGPSEKTTENINGARSNFFHCGSDRIETIKFEVYLTPDVLPHIHFCLKLCYSASLEISHLKKSTVTEIIKSVNRKSKSQINSSIINTRNELPTIIVFFLWLSIVEVQGYEILETFRLIASSDHATSAKERKSITFDYFSAEENLLCNFIYNTLAKAGFFFMVEEGIIEDLNCHDNVFTKGSIIGIIVNKDINEKHIETLCNIQSPMKCQKDEADIQTVDVSTDKLQHQTSKWYNFFLKSLEKKFHYELVDPFNIYCTFMLPIHIGIAKQFNEAIDLLQQKSFIQFRYEIFGILPSTEMFLNDCLVIKSYHCDNYNRNQLLIHGNENKKESTLFNSHGEEACDAIYNAIVSYLQQKKKSIREDDLISKDNSTLIIELGHTLHDISEAYGKVGNLRKQLDIGSESLFLKRCSSTEKEGMKSVAVTLQSLGKCYQHFEDLYNAKNCYQEALSIYKGIEGDTSPQKSDLLHQIGRIEYDECLYNESLKSFQESLKIRECLTCISDDVVETLCWIGNTHREMNHVDMALKRFQEARDMKIDAEGKNDHFEVAEILQNIGVIYDDMQLQEKSLEHFTESLRIKRKYLDDDHEDICETLSCIGNLYREIDMDRSIRFLEYILKARRKRKGNKESEIKLMIKNHEDILSLMTKKLGVKSKNKVLHSQIASHLYNLGNLHEGLEQFSEAVKNYNKSLKIYKVKKDEKHVGNLLNSLGITHSKRNAYEKAVKCFKDALVVRKAIWGDSHVDIGETLHNIGNCYAKQGNFDDALDSYQEALVIKQKNHGNGSLRYLKTLHNIGITHEETGNIDEALGCYLKCYSGRLEILEKDNLDIGFSLHSIGNIYRKQGKFVESVEYLTKSLTIKKSHLATNHLSIASTNHMLGKLFEKEGKLEEAKDLLKLTLFTYEQKLGVNINTAEVQELLGSIYESLGNLNDARRYLEKARALKEKIAGTEHISVSDTLYLIGKVKAKSGDLDDSLATFKEVMRIRQNNHGKESLGVAAVLNDVGVIQLRRGMDDIALRCFKEARHLWMTLLGENHEFVGETLVNIGEVEFGREEYIKAIASFTEAMSIFKDTRAVDHLSVAFVYFKLGKIHWHNNQLDEAIETYEKCLSIRNLQLGASLPVADVLFELGSAHFKNGDFIKARDYLGEALVINKEECPDTVKIANVVFLLGKVMMKVGYIDEAISCFKDSMEIKTYLLGGDDISVADLKYELGRIYEKKKDFKESLSFYMDCLKIRKEKLGEHEIVAETHHSIAVVEQIMNDYNAALESFSQSLTLYQKCFGDEHLSCAKVMNNIGLVYDSMKNCEESMKYHKEALRLRQKLLGKDDLKVAESLDSIAGLYQMQKYNAKALKTLKEAMRIRRQHFGNDHLEVATTLFGMGSTLADIGELDKAMDCYNASLIIRKRRLGSSSMEVAQTFHNMGSVYALKQDYSKALEQWNSSLEKYLELGLPDDHHLVSCTLSNIQMAEKFL